MKKLSCLILALALILALFCGCGTGDETGNETEEPSQATEAPDDSQGETPDDSQGEDNGEMTLPLTEDGYTFSWWCMFNSTNVEDRGDCYPWKTVAEKTGIEIEWHCATDETASTQIALMATGGDITDFVSGIAEYYEAGIPSAGEAGLWVDITDEVQEYAPNYWNYISADENLLKANLNDEGVLWSFRLISMQDPPVPQVGPMIRGDMLEEQGLDVPVTFEDWDNVLSVLQTEYPSIRGSLLLDATGLNGESHMWSSAFDMGDTDKPWVVIDGKVDYSIRGDNYEAYVRQMHDFYEKGYIFQDFSTTSFLNMEQYITNDELIEFDAPAAMGASLNTMMSAEGDFKLVGVPAAKVNANDEIHLRSGDDAVRNGGDCAAISEACDNVPLACQLMNYLWSDEGIILFNYGEEGVSFEYDSDGNPQLTELVLNNPEGLSQTATSEIYLCVRCIPILKDNISMYDDDTLDIINVWMEGADTDYKVSENVSLTFDENSTITSILGDVNTYVQEMTVKFITGEADIDAEIDDYNAELISMRIEDAIAVEQEAVDRYNAR